MKGLVTSVSAPAEKPTCRRKVNPQKKRTIMGDRSPKDNQKKTGQKQAASNSADKKKQQATAAKQTVTKKK